MITYIALLRGINVGGHKKVAMADLREVVEELGFDEPRSLLQSGNLVFRGGKRATAQLEQLLEKEVEKRLGLQSDILVRTAEEWQTIVANNPFPDAAKRDPSHLLVMCLRDAPDKKAIEALQAAITGREIVQASGREAYVVYPDGIGNSRLTHTLIEKKLGTRGTARNWNTVLRLSALVTA